MKKIFPFLLANVMLSLIAFSQTQTIRGTVSDKGSGLPLAGAFVYIKQSDTLTIISASTDSLGRYRLENAPIGRQTLEARFLGYETVVLPGLLIETGKEFIQNIQLQEKPESLAEIVVTARGENTIPHPLSNYTLKVQEQFRYPTTYYDPARLAMSLPGVVAVDDQANNISVRGNSPATLRWRLEDVEIVNPNHAANAGTFSDRPTAAGGGINILSAQLLGTSSFLTGAYPAGYGNALGGIMDMHFRNGNDEQHEFTAQASLIGLEAAAEGPLSGRQRGSYLINYRYSFAGILTAAGVDFGGEEITFQDLSFHLNFPVSNNTEIGFFGIGGLNKNIFKSPLDENKIEEEKDLFNIDFKSKMGAAGVTLKKSFSKKIKLNASVVYSGLEHKRTAEKVVGTPQPTRWTDDDINESKLALYGKISYKKNARTGWGIGMNATKEQSGFNTFFTDNFGSSEYGGEINGWLLQPFLNTYIYVTPKLKLNAGLHGHYFDFSPDHFLLAPRADLSFNPNNKQQISLAFGWYAQTQQPQTYFANIESGKNIGPTKSQQVAASFQHRFDRGLFFKTEIYHQYLYDVPVSAINGGTYSILNNIETYRPLQDTLTATGKGRNYGLDILLERPILKNSFARLGASLYRSLYTDNEGLERPTRFDGRYLINATSGREKTKKKKNKTVIKGYSIRYSFYGGFRQTPVDIGISRQLGYTVFEERRVNEKKLKDFHRIDVRFYWKWNKPKRSTTFSIDIQNVFNRKNEAYEYFDQVFDRVRTKNQLGMIPLMAYRVEF
ncbi:MAG: TonB-dependent receptor [Saprospiraceae bacterium]